ncbi:MAG: aldo/keto reductase, partial [Paenibacillus sp.]|nr:aldo/keto reductase [Paenibacillus sp.]
IAASKGISVAQLALAWILRLPNISSCIIGASRPDQVNENVKASGVQLSDAEQLEIEAILTQ